ncbi:hypothetical protein BYT27DRAFT_6854128 [Phlegmacium glaucopus]|nr:hypothetical protein BYT27DRAFT_6854128 [Phlegmacium glaucopus]
MEKAFFPLLTLFFSYPYVNHLHKSMNAFWMYQCQLCSIKRFPLGHSTTTTILDLSLQRASLGRQTKLTKPVDVFFQYWKLNPRNQIKPLRCRPGNYRKRTEKFRFGKPY